LHEYTKMVTTRAEAPDKSVVFISVSGIHLVEKVKSPDTSTGFFKLGNKIYILFMVNRGGEITNYKFEEEADLNTLNTDQ